MEIRLDHTIIPSKDKEKAAQFFARIFDLSYEGPWGHFAPVKVNDVLTMDFANQADFGIHHYAFRVDAQRFAEILSRIQTDNIEFGDAPYQRNMQISESATRKRFYFYDLDGHNIEVITKEL